MLGKDGKKFYILVQEGTGLECTRFNKFQEDSISLMLRWDSRDIDR